MSRYVDGIDVLFATNSFHIGSSDLLEHLPSLLLHQRLSRIQSLEIIWKGRTRVEGTSSPIHSLCQMVPQALPHVRQLAIFFRSSIGETRGIHFADFPDPAMVGPIEDMIRALGPGREFNVSIELSAWLTLTAKHGSLYRPNFRIEWYNTCVEGRFWKVLSPGDELGYWICSGRFSNSQ